jgi:DnaJ-class molecular chaperone
MTDRTAPAPRICPTCDGHAFAAISTGGRDRHGHLRTITVHCPTCNGLGTIPARRVGEAARA